MKKFLSYISILIILFGMSGFIFNALLIPSSVITFHNELPISDIQGIIEKNGRIYVGLGEYNRIQIYNLEGKFIEYRKTLNHSKAYDFTLDEYDNPVINVIYTRDQPIEKFIQNDGSFYTITSKFPLAIVKDNTKLNHIKIKQPFHMSLWGGSINCWLIGLVGIILFLIINISIITEVQGLNLSKEASSKEIFKRIFL